MVHDALTASEYRALAEFRYELRRFLHFSERAARSAGLQIEHHSAVELVDRMEARGLVRRARANDDRRYVLVRLTPRGEALLPLLSVFHRAELSRSLNALLAHQRRHRWLPRRRPSGLRRPSGDT